MGQKWVKNTFFQSFVDHSGCTNGLDEPISSPFWGILAPHKSKKALKVGLVVKGITCKPIPLYQRPSMCDSLVSLTIHS